MSTVRNWTLIGFKNPKLMATLIKPCLKHYFLNLCFEVMHGNCVHAAINRTSTYPHELHCIFDLKVFFFPLFFHFPPSPSLEKVLQNCLTAAMLYILSRSSSIGIMYTAPNKKYIKFTYEK